MLGSETIKRGLLDTQQVAERITELSQRYGLAVDPYAMVEDLPSACASAPRLSRRSTATPSSSWTSRQRSWTPPEIDGCSDVMELLQPGQIDHLHHAQAQGSAAHQRPHHCAARGKVVGEADPKTATQSTLAAMMVGREVILTVDKDEAQPGPVVLDMQDVSKDDHGQPALQRFAAGARRRDRRRSRQSGQRAKRLVEVLTGLRSLDSAASPSTAWT